jgi:hypothetical protein
MAEHGGMWVRRAAMAAADCNQADAPGRMESVKSCVQPAGTRRS